MATERELKLALRRRDAARIRHHPLLSDYPHQVEHLHSEYFDTPDGALRNAGVALRLRCGSAGWVLTVKAEAPDRGGLTARAEWETPLAGRELPTDFAFVEDCAIRLLLQRVQPTLTPILTTRFRRDTWTVPAVGGAIAVSLDVGTIAAGNDTLPLCELECESLGASEEALWALAQRLAESVALWPEPRSKAERGQALLAGTARQARKSRPVRWQPDLPAGEAFLASWFEIVAQAGTNLSLYALTYDAEALHQLRVALRRARALLRFCQPLLGKADTEYWRDRLGAIARQLAHLRDRQVLWQEILQPAAQGCPVAQHPLLALAQAYAPNDRTHLPLPYRALGQALIAATPQWQARLAAAPLAQTPVQELARKRLKALARRVRRRLHAWKATPELPMMHRVRIALKDWRYALEWCAELLPEKEHAKAYARVRRALDLLGAAQDWASASAILERHLRRQDEHALAAAVTLAWQHPRLVLPAEAMMPHLLSWFEVKDDEGKNDDGEH